MEPLWSLRIGGSGGLVWAEQNGSAPLIPRHRLGASRTPSSPDSSASSASVSSSTKTGITTVPCVLSSALRIALPTANDVDLRAARLDECHSVKRGYIHALGKAAGVGEHSVLRSIYRAEPVEPVVSLAAGHLAGDVLGP